MIRLVVIAVCLFGLYALLGQFAPVVFQKSFVIPQTTQSVTYITAIMAAAGLLLLAKLSYK